MRQLANLFSLKWTALQLLISAVLAVLSGGLVTFALGELTDAEKQKIKDLEDKLKEEEKARKKAEKDLKDKTDADTAAARAAEEAEATKRGEYAALKTKIEAERAAEKVAAEAQRQKGVIQLEIAKRAAKDRLVKDSYLALFDSSKLTVTGDAVAGIDDAWKAFKEGNKELFEGEGSTTGSDKNPPAVADKTAVDDMIALTDKKRLAHAPHNWPKANA